MMNIQQNIPPSPAKLVKKTSLAVLVKKIGGGSFGQIYQALYTKGNNQQQVAAKEIRKDPQRIVNNKFLQRQLQILAKLDSPHIIKYFGMEENQFYTYIYQQLADGDLKNYIDQLKKPVIPQSLAVNYICQIAQGLIYLFENGVIHRDLKPENIFYKRDPIQRQNHEKIILKIGDFGLSRFQDNLSQKTKMIGTPLYMAPQTLLPQGNYTYKCDIWSLGIIAFRLGTGKLHPCQKNIKDFINEKNRYNLMYRLIEKNLKNGFKFPQNQLLSKEYKNFVMGCLRYDENQRFDYKKIINHPLFKGKLKEKFPEYQSQKSTFIFKTIRELLQESNVNLFQIFNNIPQYLKQFDIQLSKQQFEVLMKSFNQKITKQQIQVLEKSVFKQSDHVQNGQLQNILIFYNFQIKDFQIKIMKEQMVDQKEEDNINRLNHNLNILKQYLNRNNFNQYQFYQWYKDKQINEKISAKEFLEIFQKLSSVLQNDDITQLFYQLSNNLQRINTTNMRVQFCKLFQIPLINDKNIAQQYINLRRSKINK